MYRAMARYINKQQAAVPATLSLTTTNVYFLLCTLINSVIHVLPGVRLLLIIKKGDHV